MQALDPDTYFHFLGNMAKMAGLLPIREIMMREMTPGLISMLAGKPNPIGFPVTSVAITTQTTRPDGTLSKDTIELNEATLTESLQYGSSSGLPALLTWMRELQEHVHGRNDPHYDIALGTGSQDLLFKAFATFVQPGDCVLVESPCYMGVLPIIQVLGGTAIGIQTDSEGPSSKQLAEILDTWSEDEPKPKIFYTVPCGSNPTGITTSVQRKLEILAIIQKHNLLLLEDDPYHYLCWRKDGPPASYFALEPQTNAPVGRVLRFDSLSKILSAGFRIGILSGPHLLVNAITAQTAVSNLQPSTFSHAVAHAVLSHWGLDTFLQHSKRVSSFYKKKCDVFERLLGKHFSEIAEWTKPEAGMFFWVKLKLPPSEDATEGDAFSLIRDKAFDAGVLALPGSSFLPDGEATPYIRLSFSVLEEAVADEGLRRLAAVIREAKEENSGQPEVVSARL